MPTGPEHVDATVAKIENISTAIGALGVDPAWAAKTQQRLAAVVELLQGTTDRFFLKTRVCLPFARKCEQAASGLEELVDAGDVPTDQLETALDALEKATRTLDERSMMQGMAIT
jgi:hypothetical protein